MMTHQSSDSAGLRGPVLLRCVELTLYAGGPGTVLGSPHSCDGPKTPQAGPPARPPAETLVSTLHGPQPSTWRDVRRPHPMTSAESSAVPLGRLASEGIPAGQPVTASLQGTGVPTDVLRPWHVCALQTLPLSSACRAQRPLDRLQTSSGHEPGPLCDGHTHGALLSFWSLPSVSTALTGALSRLLAHEPRARQAPSLPLGGRWVWGAAKGG